MCIEQPSFRIGKEREREREREREERERERERGGEIEHKFIRESINPAQVYLIFRRCSIYRLDHSSFPAVVSFCRNDRSAVCIRRSFWWTLKIRERSFPTTAETPFSSGQRELNERTRFMRPFNVND